MNRRLFIMVIIIGMLAGGPWMIDQAAAEKPSSAGAEKDDSHGHKKEHANAKQKSKKSHGKQADKTNAQDASYQGYFSNMDRSSVDRYYAEQFNAGKCPPGLAKKGNGCKPPGQARKWTVNKPLPPDVVFHDLPPEVAVTLGPPPSGYRFVRVAQDILMMSVGTGMVVDAIKDIGRQMGQAPHTQPLR